MMLALDPKSVWLFFFTSLFRISPFILFGFGLVTGFIFEGSSGFSLSSFVLFLAVVFLLSIPVAYIWAKLTYHFYKYELREDGFRKEHGIIWKKYVTIPYDRIQNVDIFRGLIARLLGLSDLQIQTAGGITSGSYGAFSEGRLPGLSKEVAEQLRDEVIRRAKHHRGQGL